MHRIALQNTESFSCCMLIFACKKNGRGYLRKGTDGIISNDHLAMVRYHGDVFITVKHFSDHRIEPKSSVIWFQEPIRLLFQNVIEAAKRKQRSRLNAWQQMQYL